MGPPAFWRPNCFAPSEWTSSPSITRRTAATSTPIAGRSFRKPCKSAWWNQAPRWEFAFDGDADRAIFVSSSGKLVDGDGVLLAAGRFRNPKGLLKGGVIVGTTMANLGLERALAKTGLTLIRTAVGDRYVLEEMQRIGANLGGEQSGHILFPRRRHDGRRHAHRCQDRLARCALWSARYPRGRPEDISPEDCECAGEVQATSSNRLPEICKLLQQAEPDFGKLRARGG